jgi:putative membrane protein
MTGRMTGDGMMNGMMGMMPFGGMMGNFGYSGAWRWLGWIFMVSFWILVVVIIVGIIALIYRLFKGKTKHEEKSALDILKERYARGEIDKREFEEKKKDLI